MAGKNKVIGIILLRCQIGARQELRHQETIQHEVYHYCS